MSRIGPGPKRLRKIERILKAEIRWAVTKGPGWDPKMGAVIGRGSAWTPIYGGACGVCAIGALVCHRQPVPNSSWSDAQTAARLLRVHEDWAIDLYEAVAFPDGSHVRHPTAHSLARRLRRYGDALAAKAVSK